MDVDDLRASLDRPEPPAECGPCVRALWFAAKGDWDRAHAIAQDETGRDGAWVHAHLHRIEGDLGNAGYWYRRAGRPASDAPLDQEWAEMVAALLAEGG